MNHFSYPIDLIGRDLSYNSNNPNSNSLSPLHIYLLLLLLKMQEHYPFSSITLSFIISKSSLSNLLLIAQFLDPETIQLVLSTFPHSVSEPNLKKFLEIIFVRNFTAKFLHQADRSNYMSIYEEQKFVEIENNRIKSLWLNSYPKFKQIDRTINHIKKGLSEELSSLFDVQYGLDNMFLSLNDPMPPELNLRKSDIGTYCNSSFQFYLIGKRFPPKDKYLQEPFCQLKSGLEQLRDQYFTEQNWREKISEETKEKIGYFSQYWYKINSTNYGRSLIRSENNYVSIVHNSMVYLVTLFDVMIEIVDEYLETFSEDSLHEFIQFSMRFAMLRNSLLQLENQLDFLFQMYNGVVKQVESLQTSKSEPKTPGNLSVWRCLLSKWYLYMKKRHDSLNVIYCYLFKKMNYSQFRSNLKQKQIELSHYMMSLENSLQSIEEQIQGSMMFCIQSPLMDFTQDHQFVHQLLKEYVEYMVDISVNQDSVHWCGHSDHQMHLPYQEYSQVVVQSLNEYLEKIYNICHHVDSNDKLFAEIIEKILHQMDKEYLKPLTLKKLINQIKQTWGELLVPNQDIQTNNVAQNDQTCQKLTFQLIKTISFTQRDKRVENFNIQSNIPSKFDYSCNIVIESEDFNSSLKRSANTNCTQSGDHSTFDTLQVFGGMSKSISINYDF